MKPENFLMGAECTSKSNRLYLVDLGLGETSSCVEISALLPIYQCQQSSWFW